MAPRPLVLCIQADRDNLELIERVLETTDSYELARAADGIDGLEICREQRPALVLLDLDLPLVDGFETLRRLRGDPRTADITVVAVSASVMKGERRRCMDAGFAAFVEKPFDVQELRRLVARLVAGGSGAAADGPDLPPETQDEP